MKRCYAFRSLDERGVYSERPFPWQPSHKIVVKPRNSHHHLCLGELLLGGLAATAYPLEDVLTVLFPLAPVWWYLLREQYLVDLELCDDNVGGGDGNGDGLT